MAYAFPLLTAALAAVLVGTGPALACPPPPSPPSKLIGETDAAYDARMKVLFESQRVQYRLALFNAQAEAWRQSEVVLVGRVDRVKKVKLPYPTPRGDTSQEVLVRPISFLKSKQSRRVFWVRSSGVTTCGPYGGGDAIDGAVGDHFLFFISQTKSGGHRVTDSVGPNRAEEPRVRAALALRR